MTQLTFPDVENWLDKHTDLCQDYFIRKAEIMLINKWLIAHGFLTINDYINGSRRSSNASANFFSNVEETADTDKSVPSILINGNTNISNVHHKRNNSKKCLRHDFAQCKSKSFVKSNDFTNGLISKEVLSKSRRSSLKDMRK